MALMSRLLMVSHGGVHLLALLDASSLPGCILNTLRLAFHAIQEADTIGIHRSRNIVRLIAISSEQRSTALD